MDLDLADYDQVDEAKFFIKHKVGLDSAQASSNRAQLLVKSSSSSTEQADADDTNCENDYVFLPTPPSNSNQNLTPPPTTTTVGSNHRAYEQSIKYEQSCSPSGEGVVKISTAKPAANFQSQDSRQQVCVDSLAKDVVTEIAAVQQQPQAKAPHPLMTINSNGGKNPFSSLQQMSPDSASNQAYQPFWMRAENFASKPIGVLEVSTSNTCSPSQISDLMHQIVTKSDTIYIAIPCAYCHEPIACPPSDITAWLNHMNLAHNCKVCPICNKLIGLGPMRDIEIMKKHVVSHIDDDWLEKRNVKVNFSFGLQQYWFSGGRCSVKEPRTIGIYRS